MKTLIVISLAVVLGMSLGNAQQSLVSISAFNRTGYLAWTNRLCPNQPVYQVLRASSPTGPWEHFAFVTNQTTTLLPTPAASGAAAAFFQIAWVDAPPMEFDYVFDEGYGVPAVIGRLSIVLLPRAGAWQFEDVGSIDGLHPTGVGQVRRVLWDAQDSLRVWLTGPVDGAYLDGTLQRSDRAGRCA